MKNFLFIFTILFFSIISFGTKALAASVIVSSPANVKVGDTFEVDVKADTGGVLINSIDMALDYPKDLVSFSGYKNDGTVVRFWIQTPSLKDNKIYFSGIIPGGVLGLYDANKQGLSAIPLTRLFFIAKKAGSGEISFVKSDILENDGKGTSLVHDQKNAQVTISENKDSNNIDKIVDKNSPEPFEITFIESSLFSKTPSMIIFSANDIDSGIKEYKMNAGGSAWKDAQSPQPIAKGIFGRDITIRAFDFYGNFRDSVISIPGFVSTKLLLIFFGLLIFGILCYKMLKYRL